MNNSDMISLPDNVLVTRILAGEKQLFEVFLKKYNTRLYRISMSILHDDDDAEDMMQAAYVKAYENLHRFEGRSTFLTWLTRIAINEGLMRLKKQKRIVLERRPGRHLKIRELPEQYALGCFFMMAINLVKESLNGS